MLCLATLCAGAVNAQSWQPLPEVDLAKLKPSDFRDDELDLPYYLKHFTQFAGAVVEQGPDRGFIGISVWRGAKDNKPHNARIMENILSLAFFYTTKRPWNPYYGAAPVRQRLEAALDFWCKVQSPEGKFSEYGPLQWNLAATAFATKFMGQTLTLLKNGPPIDKALLARVVEADRKAIRVVLTDDGFIKHGLTFSNQFTNVFAGGLAFLALYPDKGLDALLRKQILEDPKTRQSPIGFFYEADGPDFGYNLETHHSNLQMAWHYTRGTDLGKVLADEEQRWFEWFALNAVPEPDWKLWTLNRGIETRQKHASIPGKDSSLGEAAPAARAFAASSSEFKRSAAERRKKLEQTWPKVEPLPVEVFWAYSPYTFLHRAQFQWRPSEAQRDEARRKLPYMARKTFTTQLMDSRKPSLSTYVRRPAYYAAFNSGQLFREQQRFGLGLVWSEKTGAALQSQTASKTAAWGTLAAGRGQVYEAGDVNAKFSVNGKTVDARAGIHQLPDGPVAARYPLGSAGEKTVEFLDDAIRVSVRHAGEFTECVPLLGDALAVEAQGAETSRSEEGALEDGRRITVVRLKAAGNLTYRLAFRQPAAGAAR